MSDRKRLQAYAIIQHVREYLCRGDKDELFTPTQLLWHDKAVNLLHAYDAAPVLDISLVPDGRRRILLEILRFFSVNKKAPKTREITRQLKLSISTVVEHVGKLRDEEWIRSDITASGGLAIIPTPEAIEVYESI